MTLKPSLPSLPHQLGHYTFTELLGVHEHHEFYRATQDEVEREVIIELHRQAPGVMPHADKSFMNSVKARAHVNLPRMMQVYESVQIEGYSFVAYQLPQGVALSELAERRRELSVLSICRAIEQYATLYLSCEQLDMGTRVLTSDMIFMESEESFYFLSPLCASCHTAELALDQRPSMQALGTALLPLLPQQVKGASRTITLVSWLMEGYEGEFLDWISIQATSLDLIEQVLPNWASTKAANSLLQSKAARDRYNARAKKQRIICLGIIAACALITLISAKQIYQQFTPPRAKVTQSPNTPRSTSKNNNTNKTAQARQSEPSQSSSQAS